MSISKGIRDRIELADSLFPGQFKHVLVIRGKHPHRLQHTNGKTVIMPSSSSDSKAMRNFATDLRRVAEAV